MGEIILEIMETSHIPIKDLSSDCLLRLLSPSQVDFPLRFSFIFFAMLNVFPKQVWEGMFEQAVWAVDP